MTPDSHIQTYLSSNPISQTNQRMFIKQIYFGIDRYRNFINASNWLICQKYCPQIQFRKDSILLAIFTYLLCFRLAQLPIKQYQKMVRSQNKIKMQILHISLFDQNYLINSLVPVWKDYLQQSYLQTKILPYLSQSKDKCWDLMIKLVNQQNKTLSLNGTNVDQNTLNFTSNFTDKSKGDKSAQQTNKQEKINNFKEGSPVNQSKSQKKHVYPTTFQQFNLTKPKPKALPTPQKISNIFKASPLPKSGKKLQDIVQQKSKRLANMRTQVKSFYQSKKNQQFNLQAMNRPTNYSRLKQQAKIKQFQQNNKRIIPLLMPKYKQIQIKQNVTNILREQKRIKLNEQEQKKKLNDLMVNLRDDTQYKLYRKQMEQADNYAALETQQRRKIQMQLARQAAIEAYQNKIEQKKNVVEVMKQMASQFKIQRQKLNFQELNKKKKVIDQIHQMKQNVQSQMNKVVQTNKKIHDSQKQKRKRIQDKKKLQDKVQLQKKKQLIFQIREFQANLKNIQKRVIQSEQSNRIGLMYQMSIQQLKKRLIKVKKQQKEEEDKRRNSYILKRQQFKQSINMKASKIYQYKNQLSKQRSLQLKMKKIEKQRQQQRLNQVKIKSLNEFKKKQQQRLRKKQKQKQLMQKEIKQIQQRNAFLSKDKAAVQKNAFKSLQQGQQRQILNRQNQRLKNQYSYQIERIGDMKHFADNNKQIIKNKIQFNKLYNERKQFDNKSAQILQQEDYVVKATKYYQTRKYQKEHIQNLEKSSPYRKKIAEMSLKNSKKRIKIQNTKINQVTQQENPQIISQVQAS